jgi:hypothetical protein
MRFAKAQHHFGVEMTRQTKDVLSRLPMSTSNRQARWLVHQVEVGDLDINPPYQRGDVWTEDQCQALIRSLLSGVPIPTLIINDRDGRWWTDTNAFDPSASSGHGSYAVVDGKQRLLCLKAWFDGDLPVPASWISPAQIDQTEDTDDGPYVRFTGLNDLGRRVVGERLLIPIGECSASTLRAEAEIYLLVNGGGTPQSDADMDNAYRIANS